MFKELCKKYDMPVIIASLAVAVAFVCAVIAMPDAMLASLMDARTWITYNLGSLIKLFTLVVLVACIVLAVTKYGNIRFGKAKPKYRTWTWVVMVFCSSFSMSVMFWAVLEWAEYLVFSQPTGMTLEKTATHTFDYIFMHWGIPVWCLLVIGIIPMGYNYYVRKKGGLNVLSGCAGVLGDNPPKWVRFVVNFIYVYGTISALCISLGAGLPMLTHNLEAIIGIETTFPMTLIVALLVTAVFTWSAASGIDTGIKRFSMLCVYLTIPLLIYIFIVGYPQFSIDNTIQGLGLHLQNFIGNFLQVDPGGTGTGFAQSWTVFYFAWWISVVPCYWIFTVKISRGRSIRSIIGVLFAAAVLSTCFFFGILTNYGLGELITNGFNWDTIGQNGTILDTFYNTGDEFGFVNDFLLHIPFGNIVIVVWFVASFFMLTTMMDSSAFVLAEATSHGLKQGQDPKIGLRVFWAIVTMVVPVVLLWAGADLNVVKCLLVISSLPVAVLIALSMVSIFKWVRADFGLFSAREIQEYFMTDEEKAAYLQKRARFEQGIEEESAEGDGPSASQQLNPFHKGPKDGSGQAEEDPEPASQPA